MRDQQDSAIPILESLVDRLSQTLENIGSLLSAWISVALEGVEAEGELIDPPLGEPLPGFVKACEDQLVYLQVTLTIVKSMDHARMLTEALYGKELASERSRRVRVCDELQSLLGASKNFYLEESHDQDR